ncbi:hypothetical protein J7643_01655 [bacterium]|nr:hypothetical protein [bacterium]
MSHRVRTVGFYATITLVLAYSVYCLILELPWIDRLYPGFTLRQDNTVGAVILPDATRTLSSGDRITHVDGHPVVSGPWLNRYTAARPLGTPLTYQVERKARSAQHEKFRVTIPTQRYPLRAWLRYPLLFWLMGLLHLLVGATVSKLSPRQPLSVAHWLYSVCSALILVSAFESGNTYLLGSLGCMIPFALFGPLSLNLAMHLPRRWPVLDRHPWLPLANAGVGALSIAAMLPLWFGGQQLVAIRLLCVPAFIGVLALPASVIWTLRSPGSSPRERRQGRVLLWGGVFAFLPIGLIVVLESAGVLRSLLHPEAISLGLASFPLAIAYAILRHQLFEIEGLIKRTITYSLVISLLALLYVSLAALADWLIGGDPRLAGLVITATIAIVILPLRDGLKRLVDRSFYRPGFDLQALTEHFGLLSRTTRNPQTLLAAYGDLITLALQPRYLAVLFRASTETKGFVIADSRGHDLPLGTLLQADHLAVREVLEAPARLSPAPRDIGPFAQALLLPLLNQEGRVGCLIIGPAKSDLPYSRSARALLANLSQQLSLSYRSVQLYTEAIQRAKELEQANAELRELDHLKRDFLNTASHELRTPLASILGFAEFLEEEFGGPLSPTQHEYVSQIQEGGKRLARIIDDMLDFARLEAGTLKLAIAETDLAQVIRTELESLTPQALAAGLTLEAKLPEYPLYLPMDGRRIGQVLLNLVGNAIKFTPRGGTVSVRVRASSEGVRVEVQDTGIGISIEHQPRLFEKFFQVDASQTRERGGAGLGLAISKALIEQHGGDIGVESTLKQGSTFWFSLAAVPAPELALQGQTGHA